MSLEDQVAALTTKLAQMETMLQGSGPQPGTSAASGATPAIRVTVPRDRKFGKYGGARDDRVLEDWISDAQRAVRGQPDREAVDYLVLHLEGVAKEEVKLRPPVLWSTPSGVFQVLREAFGEQLTVNQARRRFFSRCQAEKESVQGFALALMTSIARVERLSGEELADKDTLLREQFVENLKDPLLRRDIKRWDRDHPDATFQDVRLEVDRYLEEDPHPRQPVAAREVGVEEEVELMEMTGQKRVLSDLVSGQKLLAEEVQKQQKTLMNHIDQQREVLNQQQQTLNQLLTAMALRPHSSRCFQCGEEGHFARKCPMQPTAKPIKKNGQPQKKAGNANPPPQ